MKKIYLKILITIFIIAAIGTDKNTPIKPNKLEPINTADIIHRGLKPTWSPITFGPIKFPSNCWSIKINIPTENALIGLYTNVITIGGIAPINGPKYGIIFVMNIIKDKNKELLIFTIE